MKDIQWARLLGGVSLAIAAVEMFSNGRVERNLLGVDRQDKLLKTLAVREAASGTVLLTQTKITPTLAAGLWSRVAGDVMDGILLTGAGLKTRRPLSFAVTATAVLGVVALDAIYASKITRRLLMSKVDVLHKAALDETREFSAQPTPVGVGGPQ